SSNSWIVMDSDKILQGKKYVFVTVGTTRFEELIQEVDKKEFHQLLKSFGYNALLMQIGDSKCSIENSINVDDHTSTTSTTSSTINGFTSYYYRFKPSLFNDMNNSTLIISHGGYDHSGSGSILEALEAHKPIVCVTNSRLMHNHQVELADRLARSPYSYLLPCEPATLHTVVKDDLKSYLATRQQLNDKVIDRSLRQFCRQLTEQTESLAPQSSANGGGLKTMVVLGSGGHTAEMFYLLKHVDRDRFNHMTYVLADSDKRSEDKIHINDKSGKLSIKKIPRSRKVGQSYFGSIWTTLISLMYCLLLVFKERPDVVICNGPGTCVPIVVAAYMFRFVGLKRCKIVYYESIARVNGLSLSGKILQRVADWFVYQWPELEHQIKMNNKCCNNIFFEVEQQQKLQQQQQSTSSTSRAAGNKKA
ncbi:hypothetical protein SAMD00019534_082590, partial [Acytostelium subglobosum LB1]|uniref:hypothetical protein n=1 Tax=Acytostelium subglobosum LB1 TaxID=1410327 RepID=UPI000644D726